MADAKTSAAWKEAKRAILLALNLPSEYTALGLRVAEGAKANAKGWVPAHAFGVDDKTPSAGINIQDGPLLGYYHDFKDASKNCGFFDFCIASRGGDYQSVLKHFASKTGIKLPSGEEERSIDRLEFRCGHYTRAELSYGEKSQYANGKAGVTIEALDAIGCKGATWPKGLSAELSNQLIAAPMYGSSQLIGHEPTAWHCVAVHPKKKIRQFQGKGNEDKLLKTMTLGDYGFMGLDGLKRLPEATVVNLCEGFSDLLACQAILMQSRRENPEYEKHVAISAGACSYSPKPEWMPHFAGKEIRIWGDVGDKDNAGQLGAARWVTSLLPVAGIVRNCLLPLGKDDGKNDVRAWITDEKAPRSYADMDAFAKTFTPVDASDAIANVSAHEALLKSLGLVVLGEHERSQRIEVYCEATKKSATLHDIDRLSVVKLTQLIGNEPVDKFVHEGNEPMPGKFQIKDVRKAIASAASDKLYFGEQRHGAGVWLIDDKIHLVKAREIGIVEGTRVTSSTMPFVAGHILDITQSSGDWFDCGVLSRYLAEATREQWRVDVFDQAVKLFAKWYWRQSCAPQVVTSMVIASWLQTTWEWRPQVFITGESNTGKSMLAGETITPLFGPLQLYCQKPSAAGISQTMQHHARVLLVDEFEEDKHRQQIFELFRTSSQRSGGRKLRGSASHEAVAFIVRHIPWFAAINMGLRKQPDRNRFIVLDMNELPEGKHGKIYLPSAAKLRDLGMKLLAVGIHTRAHAAEMAAELKTTAIDEVPGRVVENFSLPAGIMAATYNMDLKLAESMLRSWMGEWDFCGQSVRDHVEVLQEILTSEVLMEGGSRTTVSALLAQPTTPDVNEALARVGLRRVNKRVGPEDDRRVLFFCTNVIHRSLLKPGSNFSGHSVDQYMLRFRDAARGRQKLGGDEVFHGVEVPLSSIREAFGQKGDNGESAESGGAIGF
jgi:hypothetical protein